MANWSAISLMKACLGPPSEETMSKVPPGEMSDWRARKLMRMVYLSTSPGAGAGTERRQEEGGAGRGGSGARESGDATCGKG